MTTLIDHHTSGHTSDHSSGRDLAPGLVADLANAGTPVTRMEVVGPTLDDVFLELTGRSFRESNETTQTDSTVTEGAAA